MGWFLAPALAFYVFVVVYPSLRGTALAFTDWDGLTRDPNFVGLDQFRRLIGDSTATGTIRNTLFLAITYTILQNVVGLLLAKGVYSGIKSRNFLRVLLFSPVIVMPVASAYLWQFILTPRGALNSSLDFLGLSALKLDWLGSPSVVLWSIVIVLVWQYAGIAMAIFLAGLESIPDDLRAAAEVDGAGVWQRFRHVEWPLLAPALTVNSILSLIGGLKLFDQIIVMTGGGPGRASETMSTLIYKFAFLYGDYGYSVTMAVILTIFTGIMSAGWYWILSKRSV
jgi:raffinose/stachyose/melibiose transport system permease protein